MAVSRSQLAKSAAGGSESQYLSDWASYNRIGTLSAEQKTAALAQRSEWARSINTGSNNNNNTSQGSITNPYDIIKAGSGTSKISNMSDQFKTGINTEQDLTDTGKINDAILKQLEIESNLHTEINEGLGLTGELSKGFRDMLIESTPAAAQLGYDISNITDMITNLSEKTGKFNLIASNTLEQSFKTSRAFGMTLQQLSDAFVEFEKVGYGAADAMDKINSAGLKSASLGLNSKKTTQDLKTNIEKLNEYGFKNGIEGLNRMVQKSAEFRMNMAETFKVADKVMNPESAIELTANMQMLGGAVGDLNDPLKLMYMATNNVEGLQDAIQGAASGLAVFNSEQGRFEITGANLRRGKEMAAQLGISYSEFAKGAIAAQERLMATDTLLARGFNIDDKEKEFLTNLSQMKDGEMQIVIPKSLEKSLGEEIGKNEIKLSELTDEQVKILKKYQDDLEGKTTEQMAQEMLTETKKMSNNIEALARSLAIRGKKELFGKEGEMLSEGNKNLIPFISPILKEINDLRLDGVKLSQDPGRIAAMIKPITDELKNLTGDANGLLNITNQVISELKEQFKKGNETEKTKKQQEIEDENKRREERQKAKNNDNAFMFNANLKVTHIGLGNNMTIDQTEKGYLTPMSNMA
jgi:hypothetical protein